MQTTNLLLTLPVSHYLNLCQAKQLQSSPWYRKSLTQCSFKYKVNIVPIYLVCRGETVPFLLPWGYTWQQLPLTRTRISLCLWLSSCLCKTKSCWELADIVSVKSLKKQREKHGQAFLPFFFYNPQQVESMVCPETFPQAVSRGVWTQLSTNGGKISAR